jgi:hypothetical protein
MQQIFPLLAIVEQHVNQQPAHAIGLEIETFLKGLRSNEEGRSAGETSGKRHTYLSG